MGTPPQKAVRTGAVYGREPQPLPEPSGEGSPWLYDSGLGIRRAVLERAPKVPQGSFLGSSYC
jgi:hypothetical protein